MPVTSVTRDPAALTLTLSAHFHADVETVWQVWADPRRLERWWGPPTYPATVVDHDLTPGGTVSYYMTSPEGEKYHGWWRVRSVEAPHQLEFEDGFADADGTPDEGMPVTTAAVRLQAATEGGTTMTIVTRFPSAEAMQQLTEMGMVEGVEAAVNQIDDILKS